MVRVICVFLSLLSLAVHAEQQDLSKYSKDLLNASTKYQVDSSFIEQLQAQQQTDAYREAHKFGLNMLKENTDSLTEQIPIIESETSHDITYDILISHSMGENKIKEILSQFSKTNLPVRFVIKGMLRSEHTITDAMKRTYHYVRDLKPLPYVVLDPRPFDQHQVETVPLLMMKKGNSVIASVHGVMNPYWLKEQVETGHKGYLDVQGEVFPVSEISPTVVAAERASKLDKDKIIQDAKDNYWKKVNFFSLPLASGDRVREFRPQIQVTDDLYSIEGIKLLTKGDTVNLLDIRPFTQRMIVFDATDERQRKLVKALPAMPYGATKLVTTKVDRNKKWNAIKDLETEFSNSIYLLNADIVNRFDIHVVPSVLTADNDKKVFIIEEYDVRGIQ